MTDNKALIDKIEELERQLNDLKIELKHQARNNPNPKKSDRLEVGVEVYILNPGTNQGTSGIIIKINHQTGRATVKTQKGKVSRILRNLKAKE